MTKILLASLVAAMLALTGLVAYNSLKGPAASVTDQVTATDDDSCPACCSKDAASSDACPGCPLAEKGGCCKDEIKSACCGGDAAVKPGAAGSKVEAKKE